MKINETVLMKGLEWCYAKALSGGGPFSSAMKLANDHLLKGASKAASIEHLINWQVAKCATSGFVTGLGGLVTLPAAIPANLSSVLLLQLRMILAIAILGGFDPRQEEVKTMAFVCLTAGDSTAILRSVGIFPERRTTENIVQHMNEQVTKRINHLVKIRLLAKSGRIGILKLGKAIPLVGGVVGATLDASATKEIGKAAKRLFLLSDNRKLPSVV